MHVYDPKDRTKTVNSLLFGVDFQICVRTNNKLGRLAEGNKYGVRSTDIVDFIIQDDVPITRKVTYSKSVCDYRPLKSEPRRIRLIASGDKLE